MKKLWICLILLLSVQIGQAQYGFSGSVSDENGKVALSGVQVMLFVNDTLTAMDMTNEKGRFSINNLSQGKYLLHIEHPGYTLLETEYEIRQNMKVQLGLMREMSFTLDSVVVTASASDRIKRTATGSIYRLSEQAKNSGNPFQALKEIPQLSVNVANQSVTMNNGQAPLILINGRMVNTGIAPIDPKEIESVEVVDVVGARYLRNNVHKILNIKLKNKTKPYVFFETMGRHDFPLNKSVSALYFEIGNPKYSLYSRVAGGYTYRNKTESSGWQRNDGYFKQLDSENKDKGYDFLGEMLYKWEITPKDYLAAHVYGKKIRAESKMRGDGMWQTDREQAFTTESSNKDDSYIFTGSLYHQHTFTDDQILETTFAFNKNKNENDGNQQETYPDWVYDNRYLFKNDRASGRLNIDYSYNWGETNSLNIGSQTNFVNDHVNRVSSNNPIFHHRQWDEYLYGAFSSQIDKFYYMVSAGVEGIWLKAGDDSHHYFKPRGSISGTYNFNDHNSLQIGYTLTNNSPSVEILNPYNTSTDSLVVTAGNPYLLPSQTHDFNLSYTLDKKGFYLSPSITYQLNTDIIEPYGYSKNGIYTSSYRNNDRYQTLILDLSASYRTKWGRIYGGGGHRIDYFSGQTGKKSFYVNFGGMAWYKKFTFNADFSYNNHVYTAISRTKYRTPDYSLLQVIYNFTNNFYVSVGLEYFTGPVRTDTYTYSGNYQSFSSVKMVDKGWHPWFLIRYTFRKNRERKIKLGNVINSTEKGISVRRK